MSLQSLFTQITRYLRRYIRISKYDIRPQASSMPPTINIYSRLYAHHFLPHRFRYSRFFAWKDHAYQPKYLRQRAAEQRLPAKLLKCEAEALATFLSILLHFTRTVVVEITYASYVVLLVWSS